MGAPLNNKNAAGGRGGSSKGAKWMKSKRRASLVKVLHTKKKPTARQLRITATKKRITGNKNLVKNFKKSK